MNIHLFNSVLSGISKNDTRPLCDAIALGFDVNTINPDNHQTCLSYAIQENRTAIVRLLLSSGADIDHIDADGNSYLMLAITHTNDITMSAIILEKMAETYGPFLKNYLNHQNQEKQTALNIAIRLKRDDLVKLLIEYHVDVNLTFSFRHSERYSYLLLCADSYCRLQSRVKQAITDQKQKPTVMISEMAVVLKIAHMLLSAGCSYEGLQSSYNSAQNNHISIVLTELQNQWIKEQPLLQHLPESHLKNILCRYLTEDLMYRDHIFFLRNTTLYVLHALEHRPDLFSLLNPETDIHESQLPSFMMERVSWAHIILQKTRRESFEAARFRYGLDMIKQFVLQDSDYFVDQQADALTILNQATDLVTSKLYEHLSSERPQTIIWPFIPKIMETTPAWLISKVRKFLYIHYPLIRQILKDIKSASISTIAAHMLEPGKQIIWGAIFCGKALSDLENKLRDQRCALETVLLEKQSQGCSDLRLEPESKIVQEIRVQYAQSSAAALSLEIADFDKGVEQHICDLIANKNAEILKQDFELEILKKDMIAACYYKDSLLFFNVISKIQHESTSFCLSVINHQDHHGNTPLMLSILLNTSSWAAPLLQLGADMRIMNIERHNALMLAAIKKDLYALKLILNKNSLLPHSCINQTDRDGLTALCLAASVGFSHGVKLLLNEGAFWYPPIAENEKPVNPLILALMHGYADTAHELLVFLKDCPEESRAIIVNDKNQQGLTPLHLAAEQDFDYIVKLLLELGASFTCGGGINHNQPLMIACSKKNIRSVRAILAHLKMLGDTEVINSQNLSGQTPLFTACFHNYSEIVRLLLEEGADLLKVTPESHSSPLLIACAYGHVETVEQIISHMVRLHKQKQAEILNLKRSDGASCFSVTPYKNAGTIEKLLNIIRRERDDSSDERAPKKMRLGH